MPRQPDQQKNKVDLGPEFQQSFHKASTHSEKLHLLDLKFHKGQVIKYSQGKAGIIKWAIKTADGEYVDLETRKPLDLRDATRFLLNGHAVSWAEASTQLKDISKNMMRYKEHMLTIDFETAIAHGKLAERRQVFNVAMARTSGEGVSKKVLATDYYIADLFDDILNPQTRDSSTAMLNTMSDHVKKGYFKEFKKLAAKRNIDLAGIQNIHQLTQHRDVLHSLMTDLKQMKNQTFEYDDATTDYRVIQKGFLGTTKSSIKRGLTFAAKAKSRMENHLGIKIGDGTTIGAFNVSGVDKPAMDLMNFGDDYNVIDLRGHQLFVNATLFPGMQENLHATLGPSMNRVAKRLRMSDKEKKMFFQQTQNGLGSQFNPGTTAEDFYNTLSYSLGHTDKLTHRASHHTALRDVFNEMQTVRMSDTFVDKALRETVYPGLQYQSPRARHLSAFIQHQAVAAQMKESAIYTSKDKRHLMGMFNRKINIRALEKDVSNALESTTSIKLERDLLHSNLKQFGGNTIAHLLAGSLLLAGARVAVNKARERFSETKENNTEGLRHDSIPTMIRRLSLTDFGSPRSGSNPISAGAAILMQMFKSQISNPKGIASIVRKTLGGINQKVKNFKGKGSYLAMLRNPAKSRELNKIVFGEQGYIATMFNDLYMAGHIENQKTLDTVAKGLTKIRNISGGTKVAAYLSKGGSAKKIVDRNMAQTIANLLVTRGKDQTGNSFVKLKAPAVALGAGMFGAFAVMLSRGKYDPEEMAKPLPSKKDIQYYRGRHDRRKVRQSIMDIRNSAMEGLPIGSKERENLRFSLTDFASGWRGIISRFSGTMDDAINMTDGLVKKAIVGSRVVPKRVLTNTTTGKVLSLDFTNPSSEQQIAMRKLINRWTTGVGAGRLEGTQRLRALRELVEEARNIDRGMEKFVAGISSSRAVSKSAELIRYESLPYKAVKEIAMDLMISGAPVVTNVRMSGGQKVAKALYLVNTGDKLMPKIPKTIEMRSNLALTHNLHTDRFDKFWDKSIVHPNQKLDKSFIMLGDRVPVPSKSEFGNSFAPIFQQSGHSRRYRMIRNTGTKLGSIEDEAFAPIDKYKAYLYERLNPELNLITHGQGARTSGVPKMIDISAGSTKNMPMRGGFVESSSWGHAHADPVKGKMIPTPKKTPGMLSCYWRSTPNWQAGEYHGSRMGMASPGYAALRPLKEGAEETVVFRGSLPKSIREPIALPYPTKSGSALSIDRTEVIAGKIKSMNIKQSALPTSTGPYKPYAPAKADFINLNHIDDAQAGVIKGSPAQSSAVKREMKMSVDDAIRKDVKLTDNTSSRIDRTGRADMHRQDYVLAQKGIMRPKVPPEEGLVGESILNNNQVISQHNPPVTQSIGQMPPPSTYSTTETTRNRLRDLLVKDDMLSRSLINRKAGWYDKVPHGGSGIPFIDTNIGITDIGTKMDKTPIA